MPVFLPFSQSTQADLRRWESLSPPVPVVQTKEKRFLSFFPESIDKPIRIEYNRKCQWRHSQAVRQKSAKLLFPGPIPGGAFFPE